MAMSLAVTLAAELTLCLLIYRLRSARDLALVALANAVTNPPVMLIYWAAVIYGFGHHLFLLTILELSAITVEWLLYRRYAESIRRPLPFSLAANAASYGIGAFIGLIMR